jgi:hypothetical protein
LRQALHHGLELGNYVDDDNTNVVRDYNGNPHSYNGHNGTDIVLHDFRAMDAGLPVVAAAAGVVTAIAYANPDRNTGQPGQPANYVVIRHPDNTYAWYWHLRKNSVEVSVNESVQQGQELGLAGSSGQSTDAHLHFETGEYIDTFWQRRDPWHGTLNTLPSLWAVQEPYVGTDLMRVFDAGIFTETAAGGNIDNIPFTLFKERLSQPVRIGANERVLPVWIQLQGIAGGAYRIEIRRPNGSLYGWADYVLPDKWGYGWHYWYWNFAGNVGAGDYGIWRYLVLVDNHPVQSIPFEVGATTAFGPRFTPVSGRSFRISGAVQLDTLRVSSLGGPVTYSLVQAPSFVTLVNGNIVQIGATSNQTSRSLDFQARATDRRGPVRYDALPHRGSQQAAGPSTDADDPAAEAQPRSGFLKIAPNPFNPSTTIHYGIAASGPVTLAIYDTAGRQVCRLLREVQTSRSGSSLVGWDGRDSSGRLVASGIYWCRLSTPSQTLHAKMVLVR